MNKDLLELYSDYLLSSFSPVTATGLSAMTAGAVSHDRITRFLASEEMNSRTLWRLVKPMVRQLEEESEHSGVLIIDDTIEEKPYTEESELVCWHFDHSKGRSVKAINLISALYEVEDTSIPVAFELVKKSEWVFNDKRKKFQRKSPQTFALLLCKQVFNNEDGSEGVLYLVSSDLTLDYERMTTIYQKRWKVEQSFKDAKNLLGMEKVMSKKREQLEITLALVLVAYALGLMVGEVPRNAAHSRTAETGGLWAGQQVTGGSTGGCSYS